MDPLDKRRLYLPILQALSDLQRSARISELNKKVAEILELDAHELSRKLNERKSLFENRVGWARTDLKRSSVIDNPSSGLWTLTPQGREWLELPVEEIVKRVRKNLTQSNSKPNDELSDSDETEKWIDDLLEILQSLDPGKFERLCRRILLESGFERVNVTNEVHTKDGGIDGFGELKINDLLSFKVLFQCKRYSAGNWVSASAIRDFRGAMQGRADKGLFITTSHFSNDAKNEAIRDGVQSIQLIDGRELCVLLKKFSLGVETVEIGLPISEFFDEL